MTVDLTTQEMEMIQLALKEHGRKFGRDEVARKPVDDLLARLEIAERQGRGSPVSDPDAVFTRSS